MMSTAARKAEKYARPGNESFEETRKTYFDHDLNRVLLPGTLS